MARLEHCWDKRWPFDGRKVYEIMMNIKMAHPRGEDEPHQGYYMAVRSFHVIAMNEQDARLAWWHRYHRDSENNIISCEVLASVDSEMTMVNR